MQNKRNDNYARVYSIDDSLYVKHYATESSVATPSDSHKIQFTEFSE